MHLCLRFIGSSTLKHTVGLLLRIVSRSLDWLSGHVCMNITRPFATIANKPI